VNDKPPVSEEWSELARNGFACWKLQMTRLVEQPLALSLVEIRAMPSKRQITQHCCIQGWFAFAEWTGAPLAEILKGCKIFPQDCRVVSNQEFFVVSKPGMDSFLAIGKEEGRLLLFIW
jgi:DMSO/TMAO reductase YedYZ molybdopterin-dependent catalytic subunit